ncbi:DUF6468 domain-containing protein [Jannaschia sp. CCS1]|uniref:DUF6468 domain-containing protein n=1 Tax=Jannaschia sp. (strain CCS1) TaxID=290400 RepID=UPI000053DBB9|nr:DUF6468 domain-containing protein [Jannaschia sp. CCS1]ABD57099.1 conserved domain protein [Jannaschia sp. CCS1]
MTLLMTYGADILIIFASLGAMTYCMVLSRRLSRLSSFDKGLGGAIAVMSSQVDEMKAALKEAKSGSDGAGTELGDLVHQAREISSELEMMIAACHDFAEEAISVQVSRPGPQEDDVELDRSSTTIDEPNSKDDQASDTSVTPMFGSRRAAAKREAAQSTAPLFARHRSALG